eukprot:6489408-Amphidinium_carterae.1
MDAHTHAHTDKHAYAHMPDGHDAQIYCMGPVPGRQIGIVGISSVELVRCKTSLQTCHDEALKRS